MLWLIVVASFAVAMIAGLLQVIADPSAVMMFRWAMAALFLGGSLAWLTHYFADRLRRFFRR